MYVTNVWYKRHYLVPLHGVFSTAVLPLLKFQPSYIHTYMYKHIHIYDKCWKELTIFKIMSRGENTPLSQNHI